jgi:signal peptidase I
MNTSDGDGTPTPTSSLASRQAAERQPELSVDEVSAFRRERPPPPRSWTDRRPTGAVDGLLTAVRWTCWVVAGAAFLLAGGMPDHDPTTTEQLVFVISMLVALVFVGLAAATDWVRAKRGEPFARENWELVGLAHGARLTYHETKELRQVFDEHGALVVMWGPTPPPGGYAKPRLDGADLRFDLTNGRTPRWRLLRVRTDGDDVMVLRWRSPFDHLGPIEEPVGEAVVLVPVPRAAERGTLTPEQLAGVARHAFERFAARSGRRQNSKSTVSRDPAPAKDPKQQKQARRALVAVGVVGALVIGFIAFGLVFKMATLQSAGMEPTLHSGDHVAINKLSYHLGAIQRGDVVAYVPPAEFGFDDQTIVLQRVVGLPGDRIAIAGGQVIVNDAPLDEPYLRPQAYTRNSAEHPCWKFTPCIVPDGSVWVLRDDRAVPSDSRTFGPVPETAILGRASFTVWPFHGT